MSMRQTRCPKCGSTNVDVEQVHNPETTDLNAQATLVCADCGHRWEGHVMSDYTREQVMKGRLRV